MKSQNLRSMSHKQYRQKLIVQLIGSIRNESRRKRKSPAEEVERTRLDGKYHRIDVFPRRTKKDCVVCSIRAKGKRKETIYHCMTCPGNPAIDPEACFA